jgi:ATP-dependent Zn protease
MSSENRNLSEILRSYRDWIRERWYNIDSKVRNRIVFAFLFTEAISFGLILRRVIMQRNKGKVDGTATPHVISLGLSQLLALIKEGAVSIVNFYPDGKLVGIDKINNRIINSYRVPGSESTIFGLVSRHCAEYQFVQATPNILGAAAQVMLPIAFMGIWYKILKSFMKSATEDSTNFDRKKCIPKVSFGDVVSSSKIELQEIVDYLNHPKNYSVYGARLPRGVLLVGASGTGKTLMARAVAGEAKCAFLSVSASEFVETYVGRGSARIRQLFTQARAMSPCVLFIDEIDALGKRQAHFTGGTANDEYVQTMNQLLVELDGITGHEDGLVVIAATNRFYALDSALLRPGRFDRHVWLQLPNDKERTEILQLNCDVRSLKVEPKFDLVAIARECIAFSGADLANLVNEAVFFSLRRRSKLVSMEDMRLALEKCKQVVYHRNRNVSSQPVSPRHHFEDINTALE